MPLDFTPEPLGFRGFGVSPKPDEKETTGEPVFISDRPGDDEPQEPTQKLTLGESAADAGTFVRQSLDPIGSVVDIGKRLWQGKAPLTPSQKRLAETDYVGAATRQQNWLFSGLPHAPDFGPADPDHNPLVDIWGTPLGVYWPAFVGSRNAQETEWIKSKLLRELEDRRVLAENPVLGTLLEMGASLASPTNILPGGTIYKGIKGFNKVAALAKSVLSTGVATGVAVGIDEYILHQQQIARTLEESQMAVVGGVVLGGLFGGLIGARHGGVVAREIAVLERDLTKAVRVPERSADDPFGEGGLKALQSAGAKAVDDLSPVEMKSAAGLERLGDVGTKWWSRAWRGDGPLTRNLRSPFQSARDTGTRLYETPLTLTRNAMGEPTARDGLPVETAIKVHGESRLGEAMRQQDELFADYYFGAQKAAFKAIRAEANRVMGDNRMTLKEFREEVSRAMRRQDTHPVPQVAAAADMWRKVLFDPIADRAVRYNLYDAETIARGRPGWTPPDPAPPAPSGPPRPGGPRSGGEQPFDFARMREIEMSLLKIQSELGLPNLSGAMRDAFLERISAAIDDVTADQVSRALVDIIEGRIPRVEIDPKIAGRLRSVLEARQGAEAAGVAEDAAAAVQEALTRLREVLPEGMVDRALRTLSDAFAGKLPTVDEIVDLFRPQMESMPAPKIDPLSPFGVRQNYVRDQVESVLDMWRFATMTPRKPPESLVSWIVRNGGVMDDAGELLSMLGSYRQRPGLVRKPGPDVPKLDDVTLRAWEEGFLLGPERPEINVLLDAIDRDLRGDAVVRIGDVEALDNWRMAGEVRRELKDLGIRSGMSDETVRKIAEREALRRYDAGETGPAAAMQNGHAESVMALANVRIMKGEPVLVGAHVHDKIKTALGDDIKLVAENTMLATVTSLKPGKMIRYQGELTREVTVSVRGFGDEVTSFKLPWSVVKDMRAFAVPAGWIPGLDRPLIIFNRLAFAESASLGLRGELWHELVHNTVRQLRSSPLTLPLWRRLVDHVNGLRVLDMSQQQYYAGIRHPSATRALTDETMRDLYNVRYANRLDFQDMIDEESVAHFVELWRHGQWPKMDIEPVADLLSALEKGEFKTTEGIKKLLEAERLRVEIEQAQIATDRAAMKKASEDMMFALGPQQQRRVLDDLGFYSQALEAARAWPQKKGTVEQALKHLEGQGVKKAEIETTGLAQALEGKTSITRDELVKVLEEGRVGLKEVRLTGERDAWRRQIDEITQKIWASDESLRPELERQRAEVAARIDTSEGEGARWSSHSLDPSNPTYSETVVHLPNETDRLDFRSGHFPEPNIVGHMMTSMTLHKGKPVYTLDQIQSDWAQKIRDATREAVAQKLYQKRFEDLLPAERSAVSKEIDAATKRGERPAGARDEKKIAEIEKALHAARTTNKRVESEADDFVRQNQKHVASASAMRSEYNPLHQVPYGTAGDLEALLNYGPLEVQAKAKNIWEAWGKSDADAARIEAELRTAEAASPGHPLVNTTDQWVRTVLRQALRQAAEADAEYVAIPSGKTVLSYNPGKEEGMVGFYDKIVPTALKKIMKGEPIKVETLDSPSGKTGLGKGFTLFPLTPELKARILDEGQPMFALGPSGQKPKPKANDPEFIKRVYQRLYDEVYRDVYEPKAPQKGEPPQFDKELADIIWDDGGKPQSYLYRLYSRERILADLPRFKDILIEHFAGGQRRAQSLLDKLRDEIKRGVRRLDAKTEKQIEDLHAFTGLERTDLQSSAEQVINHILKTPDGRLVLDLPEAVRGPLRARTLRIRDSLIEDFLENDIDVVGRAYVRQMVPQIEMVRQFGDLNMTRDMQRIIDEADALMTQRPKAEHARIQKAKEYTIRDLTAMRDRLLGTYKLPEDPTALIPRVSSFVRALNYLRLLGGMTLAAFPDIARTIMVQKFAVFSDGLVPFLHGLEGFKGAASEVRLAGTAWDMVLDTRAMSIADVLDDFGRYSKLERGVASAQNRFGVISLMAPWNAALKQWVGMIVMSKILRAADDVLAGKALKPKVVEALASANLTEDVLRIIAEQAKLHGGKKGGVYLPNSTAWDVTKRGVSEALELFRGAIVRDVDRTIITPGQEKPLWISTQLGKVAGQFKTFGLSSMQRTTMAGLQDRDAGVVMGALMMVGLGAISEVLKNKVSGKDNPKTTAQWLAQAIDKSGLTGWVMDVNHFTERFTGGMIGVSALTGRPISRYASRNWADAVAGPTGGLIKDMAGSSSGFFRWMFNNEKPTESDVRALRRMIPMQNLFYLAWLFRELEEGTAKAIGARPSPKRN